MNAYLFDFNQLFCNNTIEGVKGSIWERDLLLQFLQDEESSSYAILGGDVIRIIDGNMNYTYDNWSIKKDRDSTESFESFVARCKDETKSYVTAYPADRGIVFSPIMTSEITAGLLKNY